MRGGQFELGKSGQFELGTTPVDFPDIDASDAGTCAVFAPVVVRSYLSLLTSFFRGLPLGVLQSGLI